MMFHAEVASEISPCELHLTRLFTHASNTQSTDFKSIRDRFIFFRLRFICI